MRSHTLSISFVAIGAAFILTLVPQYAAAANITVVISDNAFSGKTIDINSGDVVTWINTGSMSHTVTADNNSFDSGVIAPGGKYTQTFTQPGNYPYFCKYHGGINFQGMAGLIRVAGQAVAPTPTLTPTTQPVVTTNVTSNTTSNSNVTTQTAALLAQVVQLQQILAGLKPNMNSGGSVVPTNNVSSNAACPRIGRVLRPGMSGDDVMRLQQYLASDSSVYPEGQATGYYGALTQAAVQRWQIKYNVVSTGTPDTTGFGIVGPRTAAAISLQCSTTGNGGVIPNNTSSGPTYGGFLQVTPTTGDAPLPVSVVATVNTTHSCLSALYLLDWGDGSAVQPIPTSANGCSELQQTYLHTYTYGGQYLVKLSAGGHESTATLLINGPARTDPNKLSTTPAIKLTAPLGGQNLKSGDTLSIAWQTSGTISSGATTVFDLYTGAGVKVATNDVIAISSYPAGTLPWVIPGTGSQVCPAIYPGGLCGVNVPTGSYKIHASVRQASTAGNTFGAMIAEGDSGIFTIISSPTMPAESFSATPVSGAAPLSVTFSGVLTSADKGWCAGGCFDLLRYGDGTADFIPLPVNENSSLPFSVTHNYSTGGTYTATLFQGQTVSSPTVGAPATITVTGSQSYTYGPFNVAATGNGNPLAVSAVFDLANSCGGYRITWGDGLSDSVSTGTSGCTQNAVTEIVDHVYASGGAYTIRLLRGPSLTQQDTVSYTIQF